MSPLVLALAQDAPTWPESGGFSLARGVLALAAVVVALAAFVWVVRRGTFGLGSGTRRPGAPSIESALPLGERRSLVVVSVEGRRLLLGLAPAQVALLTELEATPRSFGDALERSVKTAPGGRS
ncbi:MAG: fliO [Acidobacteria bacterium]|nr:fliO [Acidobacteriota bacterium]